MKSARQPWMRFRGVKKICMNIQNWIYIQYWIADGKRTTSHEGSAAEGRPTVILCLHRRLGRHLARRPGKSRAQKPLPHPGDRHRPAVEKPLKQRRPERPQLPAGHFGLDPLDHDLHAEGAADGESSRDDGLAPLAAT